MFLRQIKRSIFYISSFLLVVYLLKEMSEFFEKEDISKIRYKVSKIEDFSLYSFGKKNYSLKGKSITDFGDKIYIQNPDLQIYTQDDTTYISSREAIYFPKEEYISLVGDVNIRNGQTSLNTSYLDVMTEQSIAYNKTDNTILSDKVKIEGKNLIYNIKDKTLMLEKVKTEVYGSDG